MSDWNRVTRERPCPICGHDTWCAVAKTGEVCICMRTPSRFPAKNGNGWIHVLKWRSKSVRASRAAAARLAPRPPEVDVAGYFSALEQGDRQICLARDLMPELSIPCGFILDMDVRWDDKAQAAAFPMRDAEGKVRGIRYRRLKTGEKWAFKGGHDGLFYMPGQLGAGELYVCEGPTDALAAAAIGLANVVGRSSCLTGAPIIRELAAKLGTEHVTIIADDDAPQKRPDGSVFTPGLDGARKLAQDLALPAQIVLPAEGFKDLRDWYAYGGLTLESFQDEARIFW